MSLHGDLLRQAHQLATRERQRPRQASLRRAISAAYYELFHLLVHEATNRLIGGVARAELRHCLGRAFAHADMKSVAQQFAANNVSQKVASGLRRQPLQPDLINVASAFVDLQQARHEADYDTARRFTRQEALMLVGQVDQAFEGWQRIRSSLQADVFLVALLAQKGMRM